MDHQDVAKIRKSLIEDKGFRAKFAESPGDALRSIGVSTPPGTKFTPVDLKKLEAEVDSLKAVAGANVSALYDPELVAAEMKGSQELSEGELEAVAGGGGGFNFNVQLRNAPLMNFTSQLGKVSPTRPGGGIYTISAFGTADW